MGSIALPGGRLGLDSFCTGDNVNIGDSLRRLRPPCAINAVEFEVSIFKGGTEALFAILSFVRIFCQESRIFPSEL